jgi:hypothetical protein
MLKKILEEYEHEGKRYQRQADDRRWRWKTASGSWCFCTREETEKMDNLLNHPVSRTPEGQLIDIAEDIGYGAAMQIVSDAWYEKDPYGALKVGDTYGIEEVNFLFIKGKIVGICTDNEVFHEWWHDEPSTAGRLVLKCQIWSGTLEDAFKTVEAYDNHIPKQKRDDSLMSSEVYELAFYPHKMAERLLKLEKKVDQMGIESESLG